MKQKTSITLSSDLLKEIDRMAGSKASRSAFIEEVLRNHLKAKVPEAIHARDLELINSHVDYLTREAQELDEYQAPIEWEEEARTTTPKVAVSSSIASKGVSSRVICQKSYPSLPEETSGCSIMVTELLRPKLRRPLPSL